ncbi:MAG: FAD binding domain-containing protein [Chloroflexi bacterium]|nr:FAD binding domain-containing protein [Chloroflexota bacterium]
MITNYFRPETIKEALELLSQPDTRPLGGGTWLNQPHDEKFVVVDLQALGLNKIHKAGNNLDIDACVTLQQLLESPECPVALKQAIRLDSSLNIRSTATVAGSLVSGDGRSTFATAMLALDAKITTTTDQSTETSGIGEFLPLRPTGLITKISIPLNFKTAFEMVARTPADKPIVCAALAQWTSGRTRLALGGYGKAPTLAMDGTESDGIDSAAQNAFHEASDEWASAEYRMDVAITLSKRCLEAVSSNQ